MAFKTLDELRTTVLNDELGLIDDTDNVFGTTAQRNGFIQRAIARLWPTVARLTREEFTSSTDVQDYTLTELYDVERLEILDPSTATLITDRVRSWQHYIDQDADPPTNRLLIPAVQSGLTIRAIGYAPFTIPAAGGTTTDIPPRLEWLVATGARVEAYRRMVNSYAQFERFQNENRANALSAADVLELLRDAKRDWQQGLTENARPLTAARRARLQTG